MLWVHCAPLLVLSPGLCCDYQCCRASPYSTNFKSEILFKISRQCLYQLSKAKTINVKKLKSLKKYIKDFLFYEFSDTSGVQKSWIICFVVALGSQFLGENKKKLIIYTVIVKIPRQTALIVENRQFFMLI